MDNAYKTTFDSLAEVESFVGKEVGISEWMTVDQESVNAFGKLTGDEQWIHVNPEKSSKFSPYKTTIAHGFYVLSMASRMLKQCMSIEGLAMGVNYGLDRVRFVNAVPIGSNLRARISLVEFEAIDRGAKYKMNVIFELEGQEKPACVAEWIALAYTG